MYSTTIGAHAPVWVRPGHSTGRSERVRAPPATPGRPAVPLPCSHPVLATDPLSILHDVFGYETFQGAQAEIIDHVIDGGDALVLMPTGGGKSLCYQVPAIARHRAGRGVTLVVSPLIALMHDQVGALEHLGVHAAFLNSSLTGEEAQRVARVRMSGRLVML